MLIFHILNPSRW